MDFNNNIHQFFHLSPSMLYGHVKKFRARLLPFETPSEWMIFTDRPSESSPYIIREIFCTTLTRIKILEKGSVKKPWECFIDTACWSLCCKATKGWEEENPFHVETLAQRLKYPFIVVTKGAADSRVSVRGLEQTFHQIWSHFKDFCNV